MQKESCSSCGMALSPEDLNCPKCDEHRYAKNRKMTMSVDIAHNRQTLAQAEQQLDQALQEATRQQFAGLKIIVGRGLIKEEIQRSLDTALWQDRIRDYGIEENNKGAYVIKLPRSQDT